MRETVYKLNTPVSIALLGDLHNHKYDLIISSLRSHSPQIICIAGDVMYGSCTEGDKSPLETQKNVLPFLSACTSLAPTYLSLGNHERILDAKDLTTLRRTGVKVLDNSWKSVSVDGKKIIIGGLTSGHVLDYRRYRTSLLKEDKSITLATPATRYPSMPDDYPRLKMPETGWLARFCEQEGYLILLSHHPEYWQNLCHHPINLCLSAHAHGGQVRIGEQGLFAPEQGFIPKYTKGVYEDRLVVTAGLSNTTWIPRVFNPTEVVYLLP